MNLLFIIIKILNTLIPKSKKKIIFISRPDFADNTKHIYQYIINQNLNIQLSWLIYDKDIYNILIKNNFEDIYYLKSFQGVWIYLRSKTIISSSSSLWQIKSPLQKQYDLWHGIPLKNILCMGEKNTKAIRQAGSITMRFATSSLEKALLSASFDFNAMKIAVTGQPRTDVLFSNNDKLSLLIDENIQEYSKVILYMPTYRSGYANKSEGNKFCIDNIFRMNNYNHREFMSFLEENNILLLLKLHPYEEKIYSNMTLGTNIKWITHRLLIGKNMDIHEILNQADILMTDYSSIYFDFLLLDRKIIFIAPDLDEYKKNRGFELEPYEFWTPGAKVTDQETLHKEINAKDTNSEKNQRKIICDIMFKYQDNLSSKRIFDYIRELL